MSMYSPSNSMNSLKMDVLETDIGNDPIQKFLAHKLKELQTTNEELKSQLKRRQDAITVVTDKWIEEKHRSILTVTKIWHKIHNGKWIIGINITKTESSG
ncbi:hypothetical protein FQA39_LY07261 [Lamprigera yunnana]|nr:hypothetical protein FQA39_LY07261 [Lamprigera yunnana]